MKKLFFEISQNSQEFTCASLFLNKVADKKKKLWQSRFSVNFAKLQTRPSLKEHLWTWRINQLKCDGYFHFTSDARGWR